MPWATNSSWGWLKLPNLVREAVGRLPVHPADDGHTAMPWSRGEIGNLAQDLRVREELERHGMRPTDQQGKIYEMSPRKDDEPLVEDVVKSQNWLKIAINNEVNAPQEDLEGSDQEKEVSDTEDDFLVLDEVGSDDQEMQDAENPSVAPKMIEEIPSVDPKTPEVPSVVPGTSQENPVDSQEMIQEPLIPSLLSLKVDKPVNFTPPMRAVWTSMHGRCVNCKAKGHKQNQCPKGKRKSTFCPVCFRDGMVRGNCKFCKYDA